jgi:hypothetical protein
VRTPSIVLALLLLLIGALLLVDWRFPPTAWWRVIEDFGHVPMFAVLTVALFVFLRSAMPLRPARSLVFAAVIALLLGGATEIAQLYVGRDASWGDLLRDALGVGIAVVLCMSLDEQLRMRGMQRLALLAIAMSMLGYAVLPVVEMVHAYAYRNAQFPMLASFGNPIELYWVRSLGSRRLLAGDAMRVEFTSEPYPGVSWHEPVPDWHDYRSLVAEVSNPNDLPVEITVRVHDSAHNWEFVDRFNKAFLLAPNERRVLRIDLEDVRRAPAGRAMDMRRISDVSIFRSGPKGPAAVLIHALRLEKAQ